jgi:hypothetical protein
MLSSNNLMVMNLVNLNLYFLMITLKLPLIWMPLKELKMVVFLMPLMMVKIVEMLIESY